MEREPQLQLSDAGMRRREAIFFEGVRALHGRRRRRVVARASVAGAAFVGVIVAGFTLTQRPRPAPPVAQQPGNPAVASPAPSIASPQPTLRHETQSSLVQIVSSDEAAVRKYVATPDRSLLTILDDHQLLTVLADAGKPAGLMYQDGSARVLFR